MLVDDEMKVIEAEEFSLIPTQNSATTSVNNNFNTFVVLGFGAGLIISVALAVLIYMFDNRISTKEELEALTGSDMLSTLKMVKEPKKRNK